MLTHEDTVTAVLIGSDALCEGCSDDPRTVSDEQLAKWHIDVVQTLDGLLAEVRCPQCF